MKIAKIPRYVPHPSYRDSVNGSSAVHAMKRGPAVVVDARTFLYAEPVFDDAFYPDELGGTGRDMLVSAWFAKGGTWFNIETRASMLADAIGVENIPEEWLVF